MWCLGTWHRGVVTISIQCQVPLGSETSPGINTESTKITDSNFLYVIIRNRLCSTLKNKHIINPLYSHLIHIDTISMGLPIMYFKGSQVDVFI